MASLAKKTKPVEFGSKDDFQLAQAINHFKGLPVKLSKVEAAPAAGGEVGEIKSDSKTDAVDLKPASKPAARPETKPKAGDKKPVLKQPVSQ